MSYEQIAKAHARIAHYVHKTPVFTSTTVNKQTQRHVFFKGENFQKTGAFKARGALNAILSLKERDLALSKSGVVTHSSGNHGQAVAWASKTAGLPCSVVVPENTPSIKCNAIKDYGAELIFCKNSPLSRLEVCNKVSQEKNQTVIPPYDHNDVICGQGTIAVEFLEQVPELDAIVVPVSGGGMISGIAIAAKHIKPDIKIYAVEASGKDLERCLKAGERLWPNPPQFLETIAEGIRTQQVGHVTWPILLKHIEKEVFTATDEDMVKYMKFTWERLKLVIEASSAAGVAAVMSDRFKKIDPSLRNVGVILCGGNVDLENLPW